MAGHHGAGNGLGAVGVGPRAGVGRRSRSAAVRALTAPVGLGGLPVTGGLGLLGGLLLSLLRLLILLLSSTHQDDLVHLLGDDDLGDGGAGDLLAVLGGDLVGGAHETVNAGGLNLGLTLGQGVGLLLHRAVNLRLVDGGGGGLGAGDLAGAGLRGGSGLGLSIRLATDQPEGTARGGTPLVIPRGDGRVGGTGDRQGKGRGSAPRLEQHGGQGGLGRPLGATTAVACGGSPLLGGQGPEAGECSTQGAGLGVTTHDRTSFVLTTACHRNR